MTSFDNESDNVHKVSLNEESREEMDARHKKEVKALEGSKRAGMKKAKGLKGKKGKETLAAVELEYETKEKNLVELHKTEISVLEQTGNQETKQVEATEIKDSTGGAEVDKAENKRQKAMRKKQKQKEAESQREKDIEEETANAGPSMREVEQNQMIELYLAPEGLQIADIAADGHCLFRAVAFQLGGDKDYKNVRGLCADKLAENSSEFSPFAEFDDSYEAYVERVRSSADWGGQLELQSLAKALKRDICVYSADSAPLTIHGEMVDNNKPILLSYHKHYYALGEHYNVVISG